MRKWGIFFTTILCRQWSPPGQKALWLNGAEDIFPDYTVGTDGVSFSLPANSDVIEQTASGL